MGLIELAIPFFFILIGIELVVSRVVHKKVYRLNDSINDLGMGIIDQTVNAFLATVYFMGYLWIYHHFRLFDMGADPLQNYEGIVPWLKDTIGTPWWVWVLAFLAKDFAYYWAHRMSHEMNVGWATHVAHHQSEEFNLAVALRQGAFQGFFFNFFYLPLAFVGFPPAVYITVSAIDTLYQFWIHTRTIDKLGPLEWVLNTPSHHRVHHGRDDKYVDKNHAGTLIIWDRMFGTFQEEEEEPNYGTVTPLKSWNPVWAQVMYFLKLCQLSWCAPKFMDKLRVWYREPGFLPEGVEAPTPETALPGYSKYDATVPPALGLYVLFQFAAGMILSTGFLLYNDDMTWIERILTATWTVGSLVAFGAIFERKIWAIPLEIGRMVAMPIMLGWHGTQYFGWPIPETPAITIAAVAAAVSSLAWFLYHRHIFTGVEDVNTSGPTPESA